MMGFLWLPLEAYEGLNNSEVSVTFHQYLFLSLVIGLIAFLIDGFFLSGFLRRKIVIQHTDSDSIVHVEFGDLFSKEGWKSISANDFFDSIVDDRIISSNSLHGHVISTFWKNSTLDWAKQIKTSLKDLAFEMTSRPRGNKKRYPIGTTAIARTADENFLFFALGKTDLSNNVTSATAEDVICAVRGLLKKAREVCSNQPINIPLIGSGLSRTNIKSSVLLDLILTAVFEETRESNVTERINIILPKQKSKEINLGRTLNNWK